jgi:peptidyl-prolyl cis-trans isomerase SurA
MNKIKYLYAAACLAPCAIAAEELSETGDMLDGIAAIVNEGVVLKSELAVQTDAISKRALAADPPMRLPPSNVLEEQVLESLIMKQIQMQRADRIGIQISDQMLNSAIATIAEQNGIKFEDMPRLLEADGLSYAAYRREVREQLLLDQLKRIDVVGRISVAPREIEHCLEDLEDNVVANSEYDLSHIFISVADSRTADDYAEAETEAAYVHTQLESGADFAEMAVRYSDRENALSGGGMGWRKGDQLPTIYADVVGPMAVGEYSDPIRAVSGYHIVKVNEMRGVNQRSEVQQTRLRHILITPDEIIDDATAEQQLKEAVVQIISGDDFGEVAKLLSDDPGSVNEGGEMGWSSPGAFVPEFEEVADNAEIGVISAPFKSRFGWHVLEVLERRMYDNTDEIKESSCIQRVRNGKLEEETELWLRRIRDEAFVDIRI